MKHLLKILILLIGLVMKGIFLTAQNVGIGTTTPAAKLDIRHASTFSSPTLLLYNTEADNYSRIQMENAGGSKFWHIAGFIDNVTDANSRLNFFHSIKGDVLTLNGDGKVGIGITNPTEKLTVFTGINSYGFSHSNGTVKLSSFLGGTDAYFGTISNHSLHFLTNDAVIPMTLTPGGNVGINNISPQYQLDLRGRMRIRTGTPGNIFTSPGIWFDDYRDGSNRVFLGMKDSIRLGLWGEGIPGAGWAFDFNARDGNISANNYKYNSLKTLFYNLGGADFKAINNTDNYFITYPQGSIYMTAATNPILAPVHLPNAAVITTFIVYYHDNSIGENLDVRLFQGTGSALSSLVTQTISSGTPGTSLMLTSSINHTVDNSAGFYYIVAGSTTGTWSNSSLRIDRIQINYTVANPD